MIKDDNQPPALDKHVLCQTQMWLMGFESSLSSGNDLEEDERLKGEMHERDSQEVHEDRIHEAVTGFMPLDYVFNDPYFPNQKRFTDSITIVPFSS